MSPDRKPTNQRNHAIAAALEGDVVDVVIRGCSRGGACRTKIKPGDRPALSVATRQSSRYLDGSCMKQEPPIERSEALRDAPVFGSSPFGGIFSHAIRVPRQRLATASSLPLARRSLSTSLSCPGQAFPYSASTPKLIGQTGRHKASPSIMCYLSAIRGYGGGGRVGSSIF